MCSTTAESDFEILLYHIVYIYMIRFPSTATSYVTDF